MTELNERPETGVQPAGVSWPHPAAHAHPAEEGSGGAVPAGDPLVAGVLRRLQDVPGLPVAEHGSAYEEIHDALLAALNEDSSASSGAS